MNEIILKSSHTYGISNLLFPENIRENISLLYAFLRTVDDLVDKHPQKLELFFNIKDLVLNNIDRTLNNLEYKIAKQFVDFMDRVGLEKDWIEAFFKSMEYDIYKKEYTYNELLQYMYGSAEIVGMAIVRILGLDNRYFKGARLLGRGMQMINFVRDVYEDLKIGRVYLPIEHRQIFDVDINIFNNNLRDLLRYELRIAWGWIESSKKYILDMPKIYKIPINTATELYMWIGQEIYKNPKTILNKKIRPGYVRAAIYAIKNRIFH